jgi:hypothetical protein
MNKKTESSPAVEAKAGAGRGGNVPPPEHRWPPGTSGNPGGKGRPAGWVLRDWLNQLVDTTTDELKAIVNDPDAAAAKAAAAQLWLNARSGERSKAGVPICGEAAERIMDQTAGKPLQAIEVSALGGGTTNSRLEFEISELANLLAARRPSQAALPEPSAQAVGATQIEATHG